MNLGDVLSPFIVESLAEDCVTYKNPFIRKRSLIKAFICDCLFRRHQFAEYRKEYLGPRDKVLFSTGSILDWAGENAVVWGSGFREPDSTTGSKDIRAVRGRLSREKLTQCCENVKVGDPALLLPLILPAADVAPGLRGRHHDVSVVPHFKDKELEAVKNATFNKIDIQTLDIEGFVAGILSSKFVLSSSLHGVVISHAYGVPALWVKGNYTGSSDFKFHDYLSVFSLDKGYPELALRDVLAADCSEIEKLFNTYQHYTLPSQHSIRALRKELLSVAPFKLKSKYSEYL